MSDRPSPTPQREPYEVLNESARTPGRPDMPTDVRQMLRDQPGAASAKPPAEGTAGSPNDVQALLRASTAHAEKAGAFAVPERRRRPSRRRRDYWVVTIAMNLVLLFAAFGPFGGGVAMIFALACVIIFNLGFTWTMFFVLDDY